MSTEYTAPFKAKSHQAPVLCKISTLITKKNVCVCVYVCNMLIVWLAIMVARLQYLTFCLFEMYVNVVFVIRGLYSAVSLTLVKERRFIRFIIIIIITKMHYTTPPSVRSPPAARPGGRGLVVAVSVVTRWRRILCAPCGQSCCAAGCCSCERSWPGAPASWACWTLVTGHRERERESRRWSTGQKQRNWSVSYSVGCTASKLGTHWHAPVNILTI